MSKELILIGAGGHAKSVLNTILKNNMKIKGIVDNDKSKHGLEILGVRVLGDDSILNSESSANICLVNGVGSTKNCDIREKVFKKFKKEGFSFETIIASSANVAETAIIKEGAHILENSIVGPDACIEENSIVNTGALIEHDCKLGKHSHLAPGAVMCGSTIVGGNVHIGAGATIIQNLNIGDHSLIGAGAVVIKNIENNSSVKGIPAK